MRKIITWFLLGVVLSLAAVGCRKVPVTDYNYTVPQQLTTAKVKAAILKGCSERGWQTTELSPSLIEARLLVRSKHNVVVHIPYTAQGYTIKYVKSANMDYQEKSNGEKVIHSSYKRWLDYLSNQINMHLI